jgi:hypothetical protein
MAYYPKNRDASRISLHKSSKVIITFSYTCSMSEHGESTGNDVLSTSEDFHHNDTPTSTAEPGSSAPSPPQSSSPMPKIEVGPEYVMQADATSSCVTQTIVAGIGGLGLGSLAGLAFGSVEGVETGAQHASARATATAAAREAGSRAWSYAKGFGGVGALYRCSHSMGRPWLCMSRWFERVKICELTCTA